MATNENEMTVLELPDVQQMTLADVLYILQGSGEDRDKKTTIEKLRDFLAVNFESIVLAGTLISSTISKGTIEIKGHNRSFKVDSNGVTIKNLDFETTINNDGIKVKNGTNIFEIKNGEIEITDFAVKTDGGMLASTFTATGTSIFQNLKILGSLTAVNLIANKMKSNGPLILPLIDWASESDYPENPEQGQLCVVKNSMTQKYNICVYDSSAWRVIS